MKSKKRKNKKHISRKTQNVSRCPVCGEKLYNGHCIKCKADPPLQDMYIKY